MFKIKKNEKKNVAFLPQLAKDLLHPTPEQEKRRHKKKRLVQSPNSYFMDVKCPGQFTYELYLRFKWKHVH